MIINNQQILITKHKQQQKTENNPSNHDLTFSLKTNSKTLPLVIIIQSPSQYPWILFYNIKMDNQSQYDPFKYPPDMELARLHCKCSEPGDENPDGAICPCCSIQQKKLITDWPKRNINEDFKQHGAIKSYFSLLKFYCFAILLVIAFYSGYQMYCIQYICSKTYDQQNSCLQVFGVWIISNMDLASIMKKEDQGKLTIFQILRSVAFLILVISNMVSLVVASKNKSIIIDVSSYALFFKSIDPQWNEEDLANAIKQLDPAIQIKDILFFKKTSSYAHWYNTKINTYFALKDDTLKPKQRDKLQKLLIKSIQQSKFYENRIHQETPRAIVLFNHLSDRSTVYKKFSITMTTETLRTIGIVKQQMYVTRAPLLQDSIWENMGEESKQKTKMKVITFLLMLVILGISYVVLHFGMIMADKEDRKTINVGEKFWSTFIALLIVALALIFRAFMNKLADMRRPNTKTSRTLFIVSTTVIYHFIYFLILPTIYFVAAQQDRSRKLYSISYQALNFLIVQLLIAGFDLFYCCWDRGRNKIFAKGRQGLCQKQMNKVLTSPRFAMEFKLIIMFKSWSFVTFYGFEVPYIFVFIFLIMVFIYVMDKRHIYTHYRVQLIQSKVEYNFLKIYSNFFTVYMCVVFLMTQHLKYQIYIAIAISLVAIVFQLLYTARRVEINIQNNVSLDEFDPVHTYRSKYQQFFKSLSNPEIDGEIEKFGYSLNLGINASEEQTAQTEQKLLR